MCNSFYYCTVKALVAKRCDVDLNPSPVFQQVAVRRLDRLGPIQ
jgi:hypothetical protein